MATASPSRFDEDEATVSRIHQAGSRYSAMYAIPRPISTTVSADCVFVVEGPRNIHPPGPTPFAKCYTTPHCTGFVALVALLKHYADMTESMVIAEQLVNSDIWNKISAPQVPNDAERLRELSCIGMRYWFFFSRAAAVSMLGLLKTQLSGESLTPGRQPRASKDAPPSGPFAIHPGRFKNGSHLRHVISSLHGGTTAFAAQPPASEPVTYDIPTQHSTGGRTAAYSAIYDQPASDEDDDPMADDAPRLDSAASRGPACPLPANNILRPLCVSSWNNDFINHVHTQNGLCEEQGDLLDYFTSDTEWRPPEFVRNNHLANEMKGTLSELYRTASREHIAAAEDLRKKLLEDTTKAGGDLDFESLSDADVIRFVREGTNGLTDTPGGGIPVSCNDDAGASQFESALESAYPLYHRAKRWCEVAKPVFMRNLSFHMYMSRWIALHAKVFRSMDTVEDGVPDVFWKISRQYDLLMRDVASAGPFIGRPSDPDGFRDQALSPTPKRRRLSRARCCIAPAGPTAEQIAYADLQSVNGTMGDAVDFSSHFAKWFGNHIMVSNGLTKTQSMLVQVLISMAGRIGLLTTEYGCLSVTILGGYGTGKSRMLMTVRAYLPACCIGPLSGSFSAQGSYMNIAAKISVSDEKKRITDETQRRQLCQSQASGQIEHTRNEPHPITKILRPQHRSWVSLVHEFAASNEPTKGALGDRCLEIIVNPAPDQRDCVGMSTMDRVVAPPREVPSKAARIVNNLATAMTYRITEAINLGLVPDGSAMVYVLFRLAEVYLGDAYYSQPLRDIDKVKATALSATIHERAWMWLQKVRHECDGSDRSMWEYITCTMYMRAHSVWQAFYWVHSLTNRDGLVAKVAGILRGMISFTGGVPRTDADGKYFIIESNYEELVDQVMSALGRQHGTGVVDSILCKLRTSRHESDIVLAISEGAKRTANQKILAKYILDPRVVSEAGSRFRDALKEILAKPGQWHVSMAEDAVVFPRTVRDMLRDVGSSSGHDTPAALTNNISVVSMKNEFVLLTRESCPGTDRFTFNLGETHCNCCSVFDHEAIGTPGGLPVVPPNAERCGHEVQDLYSTMGYDDAWKIRGSTVGSPLIVPISYIIDILNDASGLNNPDVRMREFKRMFFALEGVVQPGDRIVTGLSVDDDSTSFDECEFRMPDKPSVTVRNPHFQGGFIPGAAATRKVAVVDETTEFVPGEPAYECLLPSNAEEVTFTVKAKLLDLISEAYAWQATGQACPQRLQPSVVFYENCEVTVHVAPGKTVEDTFRLSRRCCGDGDLSDYLISHLDEAYELDPSTHQIVVSVDGGGISLDADRSDGDGPPPNDVVVVCLEHVDGWIRRCERGILYVHAV